MVKSIPSFSRAATAIITATERADQAWGKASAATAQQITMYLDSCTVSGLTRDATNAKAIGAAVREGFEKYILTGAIKKATVANYATGAARAFFHNVEWTPRTFQDPALAVPDANGKTKTRKSGSVTTTDAKALVKTLVKALEQCRTIGNDATAAGIVDLIIEIDPEFKEPTGE